MTNDPIVMQPETISVFKWLAVQPDRVLFILALIAGAYMLIRVLRRSETQTDQLLKELNDQRASHTDRMDKTVAQLFSSNERVSQVVATNTATLEHTNHVLEQVKAKL